MLMPKTQQKSVTTDSECLSLHMPQQLPSKDLVCVHYRRHTQKTVDIDFQIAA